MIKSSIYSPSSFVIHACSCLKIRQTARQLTDTKRFCDTNKDQLSLTNPARRTAERRTCDKLATELSWQCFASTVAIFNHLSGINVSYLHLAPPLGVAPFEFCREFWHQKTRVSGLPCGVICVILHLAVSVEHRLNNNNNNNNNSICKAPEWQKTSVADGRTDTRRQLILALASVAR